jgi:hypothetical protein
MDGGSVRRSKAAKAGEVNVSQVHRTKATSNETAMRTEVRFGGRRTITAQSWQRVPTPMQFGRIRSILVIASVGIARAITIKSLRLILLVRLAR